MKRLISTLAFVAVVAVATAGFAAAQGQGSLFTITWGESNVAGLSAVVRCSLGEHWSYTFSNTTNDPIVFTYGFIGESGSYEKTIGPHERWTLTHDSSRFACDTNGPLKIDAAVRRP